MKVHSLTSICGGDLHANVDIARKIAAGKGEEAHHDLIVINAAHALVLAKIAPTPETGATIASDLLHSGSVQSMIERYIEASNDFSSH